MAKYSGSQLYLKFASTVLSGEYRTLTVSETQNVADASAGDDTGTTRVSTLTDATFTVEMVALAGTAGTAIWGAVDPGAQGTLEWGPEGTATTKPKYTQYVIVAGRDQNIVYNDVVTWSITFNSNDQNKIVQSAY